MKRLFYTSLLLTSFFVFQGCFVRTHGVRRAHTYTYAYAEPTDVYVAAAPPPVQVRTHVIPARPSAQATWIDGHWDWRGNQWVWIEGRWQTPRAGYVWQAPVVVRGQQGRYRYHRGYWRAQTRQPRAAYTRPDRIVVHARTNPPRNQVQATVPARRQIVQPRTTPATGVRVAPRTTTPRTTTRTVPVRTNPRVQVRPPVSRTTVVKPRARVIKPIKKPTSSRSNGQNSFRSNAPPSGKAQQLLNRKK